MVSELEAEGFQFFEEAIWSSALQTSDLPLLRRFLDRNGYKNVSVSIVRPSDEKSARVVWLRYYREDGQCLVRDQQLSIPAESNHLRLVLGFRSESDLSKSPEKAIQVVSALRLIFGIAVARELILHSEFSALDQDRGPYSEVSFASPFDTQDINRWDTPPISDALIRDVPQEASFLLDKAVAQKFPQERFILMWLAFEACVHNLHGASGNGTKRQNYFINELGSEKANHEVFRLFKLRSEVFKEGSFSSSRMDDECWSLYYALQLVNLQDCPQRKALVLGYEAYIEKKQARDS
ncbi:hypothetical protein M3P21_05360 [Ruegeria sp. 2012CJ41-6]|uniref:Apea-like HEPN domain-containing protein n=1 Tax=Ruegeria spongiae TaxID=2942209 RepID=A0ABT0PZ99_9RHOB|nr:hypothetical protein [Ruegeria spongiae]MCL6282956.1 hypothetical protein [Ruegeria spongiae]